MQDVDPHLLYASLEHIKQMARRELARRYEPDSDESQAHQGDMFSGLLQDAYPQRERTASGEPIYAPRDELSDEDIEWNIAALNKAAKARMQHADALRAYLDERRRLAIKTAA